jgi:YesN/AraC family two-component response regulator
MIQQGNFKAAFDVYRKLGTISNGLYTSTPNIQTALTSAAVGRTLMRKSAEQAGLQPTVVDSISQAYVQKLNSVKSYADIDSILLDLLKEYCEAVRDIHRENFSPHVRKAADYIKLNLDKPLPLNEISNALGITANHLSHLFKKEAGISVSQYIAERRCYRASELLLATDLTVQTISAYVGYLDNNYFVKVFKSHYGTAPTEYRKQNKPRSISLKK